MINYGSCQICFMFVFLLVILMLVLCLCKKSNIDHFVNTKDLNCNESNQINKLLTDANCNLNNNNSCSRKCAETYTPVYNKCGLFGKGNQNLNINKYVRCQNPDYSNDLNSKTGPNKLNCTNIAKNIIKPMCGGNILNEQISKNNICNDKCKNAINSDWNNVNCSRHFNDNTNLNYNISTLNSCNMPQQSSTGELNRNDEDNGENGENGYYDGNGENGENSENGENGENGINGVSEGQNADNSGNGNGYDGGNGYYEDGGVSKPSITQVPDLLCDTNLFKNVNEYCCDSGYNNKTGLCPEVPDPENVCQNTSKNTKCRNNVQKVLKCYSDSINQSDSKELKNFFNTCKNMINDTTTQQPTIQSNTQSNNNFCNNFTNDSNGVISTSDFLNAISNFGKSCDNNNINCLPSNNKNFGEDEIRTLLTCKNNNQNNDNFCNNYTSDVNGVISNTDFANAMSNFNQSCNNDNVYCLSGNKKFGTDEVNTLLACKP